MRQGQLVRQTLREGDIVRDEHEPDRLRRQGEARFAVLGERAVQADGLEVQADEHLVERVLHHSRIAPGGPGRELLALEKDHLAAGSRQVGRARHADDAATDHEDVRWPDGGRRRKTGHRRR